jgi:hypothetical protein
MNETQYAELLIQGKITVPKERIMAALLAHQSIDSLQAQRFDPSRADYYNGVVENGKRLLTEKRERERLISQEAFQKRIAVMSTEIWKLLTTAFQWDYARIGKTVELDAKIEFEPAFLAGPTVTSDGTKIGEHPCLLKHYSKKIEIDLRKSLGPWVTEMATSLVRENKQLKAIPIYKEMILANSSLEIVCPFANPLLGPEGKCSTYTSGSDRVLGCSELRLTLKEK